MARMAKLKSFVALVKRKLLVRGVPMVREVTLDPLALLVLVEMVMLLVLLHPLVPRALVVLLASLVLLVLRAKLVPKEPLWTSGTSVPPSPVPGATEINLALLAAKESLAPLVFSPIPAPALLEKASEELKVNLDLLAGLEPLASVVGRVLLGKLESEVFPDPLALWVLLAKMETLEVRDPLDLPAPL